MDAALALAENGETVILKPPVGVRSPAGETADSLIMRVGNGRPFDIKTPTTGDAEAVFRNIRNANGQAQGVVLDLRKTAVKLTDLGNVMARLQGAGATNIEEVIVIKADGTIEHLLRIPK